MKRTNPMTIFNIYEYKDKLQFFFTVILNINYRTTRENYIINKDASKKLFQLSQFNNQSVAKLFKLIV